MSQENKNELVLVYTGSPINAEIINQMLNENGILSQIKNELMSTLAPWQVSGGGFEPVEIYVLGSDEEEAKSIVNAFQNSI